MNKSVYAAIGNAAAQENANAKSINWAVSYLENTEYDWMAKQLESEEKRRGKIYLKTLVGCIVATLLLLAPTVLLSDYLENMSHAQYSSDNQRQATVFRNDGIILWTYNSQRFEKPLSEIPYDGEANRITIDVDENGNYLGVGKVPSTFSGVWVVIPSVVLAMLIVMVGLWVRFYVFPKKCPLVTLYLKWANKVKTPTIEGWLDYYANRT